MRLAEFASTLHAPCVEDRNLTGVCIDSREIKPGNLFVALKGEHFDGQYFIRQAVEKGAAAIVCCELIQDLGVPQLIHSDPVNALIKMADFHRRQFNCDVIALTGSNGKTTVKEMIAAILPQPSLATHGNLNNHIGVPLSVLELKSEHRFAVFELGANHAGEIAHTVDIVKPNVTLINNIAPAHIEGFGSVDGVAKAKGEIHQGLASNGTVIINEDDAYAHFWDNQLMDRKILRFSRHKLTPIHAREVFLNEQNCAQFILEMPLGDARINLQLPGLHQVSNALAAAACSHALGLPVSKIALGLNNFSGVSGRMTRLIGKNDSLVIDDTYNANLRSVVAAIDVLARYQGLRILVLGDMGELGQWSKKHHEEVGEYARALAIDVVMTCGQDSALAAKAFGGSHYSSQQSLMHDLLPQLRTGTTVLVKGSRSAAMEKIVHQIIGN